jgi:hypothetical protein
MNFRNHRWNQRRTSNWLEDLGCVGIINFLVWNMNALEQRKEGRLCIWIVICFIPDLAT